MDGLGITPFFFSLFLFFFFLGPVSSFPIVQRTLLCLSGGWNVISETQIKLALAGPAGLGHPTPLLIGKLPLKSSWLSLLFEFFQEPGRKVRK